MKRKNYKFLLMFALTILSSCSRTEKKNVLISETKVKSDFDANLKRFLDKGMEMEINKINLTPDNIPDYVCFEESLSFGNLEFTECFYDGKTRNELKSYRYIFPHTVEDYRFLNVSHTENYKAMLFTYQLEIEDEDEDNLRIVKYNSITKQMEVIFEHSLLIRNGNKIEKAYYIDAFSAKKDFVDTINIYEGKLQDDTNSSNKPNIVPENKKILKQFRYNPTKQLFE